MNKYRVPYYCIASIVAVILIACFVLAELSEATLLLLPLGAVAFVLLLIVQPRSTIEPDTAFRLRRAGAALIDVAWFVLLLQLATIPIKSLLYAGAPGVGPEAFVILPILCFASYLSLSLPFAKNGQSIGKRLMGIQVVDISGNRLSMFRFIVVRAMPIFVIVLASIGLLGIPLLIDLGLGYLRKDRRCGHDFLVRTKVVACRETSSSGSRTTPLEHATSEEPQRS